MNKDFSVVEKEMITRICKKLQMCRHCLYYDEEYQCIEIQGPILTNMADDITHEFNVRFTKESDSCIEISFTHVETVNSFPFLRMRGNDIQALFRGAVAFKGYPLWSDYVEECRL